MIARASFRSVPLTITPPSIGGLVAEYIVAIDVTRVRFPADAFVNALAWPRCIRLAAAEQAFGRLTGQRSGAVVSVLGS